MKKTGPIHTIKLVGDSLFILLLKNLNCARNAREVFIKTKYNSEY